MPNLAWHHLYTASVELPCPNRINRFVHTDGDRKTELLNLSLRYIFCRFIFAKNIQVQTASTEKFCADEIYGWSRKVKTKKL